MDAGKTDAAGNNTKSAMTPLEKIRYNWGSAYEIEHQGDKWRARRLDRLGGWLEADSADTLRTLIFNLAQQVGLGVLDDRLDRVLLRRGGRGT